MSVLNLAGRSRSKRPMRLILLIAILYLCVMAAAADAQDHGAVPALAPDPQQRFPGPISGGFDLQPTQSEIEQRERDSGAADQKEARQQTREVEQLYNQLIGPNQQCSGSQGCTGE